MTIPWPPDAEQHALLAGLAALIERGGAARFLDAPVARADERDFPEPWQPTAAAVERLLARLLWLAHVDLDVAIDDLRRVGDGAQSLRRSAIDWIDTTDGVARFQIEAIGDDDMAGRLSHEVGCAFAAWAPTAAPYRDMVAPPPSARDGSIAAVYLGLGVPAANAARHGVWHRAGGVGAWGVVTYGGLPPQAMAYLLAVQAVLRADPIEAHATLRGELRVSVPDAILDLTPHRAALAERLGLDLDAPRPRLARDPAPATVSDADRPEPDRRRRGAGERTYRCGRSRLGDRAGLGVVLGGATAATIGVLGLIASPIVLAALVLAPGVAGGVIGARRTADYCTRHDCGAVIPADAATCPGCGATVAGRVRHPGEHAARELEHDD